MNLFDCHTRCHQDHPGDTIKDNRFASSIILKRSPKVGLHLTTKEVVYLPPVRKLWEGNVFSRVCTGGVCWGGPCVGLSTGPSPVHLFKLTT